MKHTVLFFIFCSAIVVGVHVQAQQRNIVSSPYHISPYTTATKVHIYGDNVSDSSHDVEDAQLAEEEFIAKLIQHYNPGYEERLLRLSKEYLQNSLSDAFSYLGDFLVVNKIETKTSEAVASIAKKAVLTPPSYQGNIKLTPSSDISFEMNQRIEAFIKMYTGRKRDVFQRGLKRAYIYYAMVERIFIEEGLPHDLFYLAMVESNFNYKAVSRANAVGLWQFIRGTGKEYKLQIDWWVDERLNVYKSTRAAARLLKDLYRQLGDWNLALAAYNSGAGTVRKAIKRNLKKGKPTDYWNLRLPRETRGYVPAFYAVITIFKDLEKYGFYTHETIAKEPTHSQLEIPASISFQQMEKKLGISTNSLKEYNPALKYGITPPNNPYEIRIPTYVKVSKEQIDTLKKEQTSQFISYRVKTGDSLWKISRKYNVSMRAMLLHNPRIKKRKYLKVGQKIVVPSPLTAKKKSYAKKSSHKKPLLKGDIYIVQSGDNLWTIAKKHGTSFQQIVKLNSHLKNKRYLKRGDKVVIHLKKHDKMEYFHTIKMKDTLWSIARQHNIPLSKILQYNPQLGNRRFLVVGSEITLPTKYAINNYSSVSNAKNIKHRVKKGETLWEIARKYNVSIRSIVSANKAINSARKIKAGSDIKIIL